PLSPLLEELVALDPAGVDNPGLDRRLYRLGPAEAAKSLLAFPGRADVAAAAHRSPTKAAPDGDEPPSPSDAWFASLRRQVFFEAPADFLRQFGLASPAKMTPFPALPRFLDLVSGHAEKEPVRDRLTAALSRADRVPEAVIEKHQLGIRTHGEAPVATTFFRSLPVEDFDIEIHLPRSLYVEHLPNRVHLRYRPAAGADLELSLELYQLVEKLYSGYRLGATELDALFGNLDVFRQRLLRLPTDRITAHHPAHGLHTIRTELRDGVRRLILEKEGE
ncbi:MAG: hypothetical protein ACE5D3_07865, partial [Candidatus Binatia bacterium]